MERYNRKFTDDILCEYIEDISLSLYENTFDIDKDVDYIYDKFFKKIVEDFKNKKVDNNYIKYVDSKTYEIDSSELKTEDAKKANAINPIKIYGKFFTSDSSYYDVKKQIIVLAFKKPNIQILIDYNYDYEKIKNDYGKNQFEYLMKQVSEGVKSTIAHELSHWINDSLHNRFANKLADLVKKYNNPELWNLGEKDVNLTYFEIDAQIHGIKSIKKLKGHLWDSMKMDDLFMEYPSLRSIGNRVYHLYGKDVLEIWEKNFLKRMHREGLLGKNMKGFVNLNIFKENEIYRI